MSTTSRTSQSSSSSRRRGHQLVLGGVAAAVVAAAVSGGALSQAASPVAAAEAAPAATTGTTIPTSTLVLSGLRNVRYCEIFLINPGPSATTVHNTTGLDDCPTAQWTSLDPKKVAKQYHVQSVFKNGPRYWTLDRIIQDSTKQVNNFNGVLARFWGNTTIRGGSGGSAAPPYTVTVVDRSSQWFYEAGSLVYVLSAPDGKRYYMQAYSTIVDKSLKMDDLPQLKYRLQPPKGWTYETRILDSNLSLIPTNNKANVIQDELQDSYMQQPS